MSFIHLEQLVDDINFWAKYKKCFEMAVEKLGYEVYE
jgi:hypothetical protein